MTQAPPGFNPRLTWVRQGQAGVDAQAAVGKRPVERGVGLVEGDGTGHGALGGLHPETAPGGVQPGVVEDPVETRMVRGKGGAEEAEPTRIEALFLQHAAERLHYEAV